MSTSHQRRIGGLRPQFLVLALPLGGWLTITIELGYESRRPELAAPASAGVSVAARWPNNERVVYVAIDSLDPVYPVLNGLATGFGTPGTPNTYANWLMPNVRAFLQRATWWANARGHMPHSTDSNHLNAVAGTHTGFNGVLSVAQQPEVWGPIALTSGQIHLAKTRSPSGDHVTTLFDLVKQAAGGVGQTAYLGNKGWVPLQYTSTEGSVSPVDIAVNGTQYPTYITTAPYTYSWWDPPTDPDGPCDPETSSQKANPLLHVGASRHPRDAWIIDAAIQVLQQEEPLVTYILLGDLDNGQHAFGDLRAPWQWVGGSQPTLPPRCQPQPDYEYVGRHNPALRKSPVLDLVRDVDAHFGRLIRAIDALGAARGLQFHIILLSDHGMVTHLHRDTPGFYDQTDVVAKLAAANLAPAGHFLHYGISSIAMLYWRPYFKLIHPDVVQQAKAVLLASEAANPMTGARETPWHVSDRRDMLIGKPAAGLPPGEFFHSYIVPIANNPTAPAYVNEPVRAWPDLVVLLKNGWKLAEDASLMNAGHGAADTASVMLAIDGLGFGRGTRCLDSASLADIAVTAASYFGLSFPAGSTIGQQLGRQNCAPTLP